MDSPVVHFEIGGVDAERSRTFYQQLFGWTVQTERHGYGVVDTGSDVGIAGVIMQTPPGAPPWVTVYVGVADIGKSLARAEELGGRRLLDPVPVEGVGEVAMFADPDGNPIGLVTQSGT